MTMRVRRDDCDPVARPNSKPLEGSRRPVAAIEELFIRQTQVAIDDRGTVSVEAPRPAGKLQGSEGDFHRDVASIRLARRRFAPRRPLTVQHIDFVSHSLLANA
jgi:hypothetical protein